MNSLFNRKTAALGLLTLLLVAILSCGQISLSGFGVSFGSETIECKTITSTVFSVSNFSLKEPLVLIGSLLLLISLSTLAQRLVWYKGSRSLDPPQIVLTDIPKQLDTITTRMEEAFRKGIIHSQIYDSLK